MQFLDDKTLKELFTDFPVDTDKNTEPQNNQQNKQNKQKQQKQQKQQQNKTSTQTEGRDDDTVHTPNPQPIQQQSTIPPPQPNNVLSNVHQVNNFTNPMPRIPPMYFPHSNVTINYNIVHKN